MQRVEERVSDGCILELLRGWLKQDIMQDLQRWTPTEGTPQGAVISPLLANIYLHPLEDLIAAPCHRMEPLCHPPRLLFKTPHHPTTPPPHIHPPPRAHL